MVDDGSFSPAVLAGCAVCDTGSAEESAAASEELSSQAQLLKELVSKFTLKDGSADPAPQPAQPARKSMDVSEPSSMISYGDNDKY